MGIGNENSGGNEEQASVRSHSELLVREACTFLETVAASSSLTAEANSKVLVSLLTPLDALQRNGALFENANVILIACTYMKAMSSMIEKGAVSSSLVNAMVQFSIDLLSKGDEQTLLDVAEGMLATCLSNDAITNPRQESIALDMARQGKWKAWAIIVASCPSALNKSLHVAREALADFQDPVRHVGALLAIRNILQGVDATTSPVVGLVLKETGSSCLGLFKAYATVAIPIKDFEINRMVVSADVMKIIMISLQSLSGQENEQLVAYLTVVFELLVDVIQYNGLPNQASPQPGANPLLGRLAAHSIVHVARTTPVAFKETVAGFTSSPNGRAILEFAVRAEISGYAAVAGVAPPKKKLNLKSFHK